MSREKVMIFDTTLRDGEQSPGCSMAQPEKLRVARALAELPRGLAVLEAHLKDRRFLVGEHLTIADMAVAEPIGVADFAGVDLTAYPHIRAWYGELSVRPAFQKTRPKG